MSGKILQVNLSNGGVPKRAVLLGNLKRQGFIGDRFAHPRFHGGADQAVLLISSELIEQLAALGYPVYPGALGENLTTIGLDHRQWRAGQQFHAGSARIELTKPRVPCRTLDLYGKGYNGIPIQSYIYEAKVKRGDASADSWGRSGFYARVIQPGAIVAGDAITLESELA